MRVFKIIFFVFLSMQIHAANLTVKISGIRNKTDSHLSITLYDQEGPFPMQHQRGIRKVLDWQGEEIVQVVFTDLAMGEYALAGLHDFNANEKLDRGFLGIPLEGYLSSGNKTRPSWKNSKFNIGLSDLTVAVKVIYW